jgi:hypothetical protein
MAFGSRAGTVKTSGRDLRENVHEAARRKLGRITRAGGRQIELCFRIEPNLDDAQRTLASWRTSTVDVVDGLATSARRWYRHERCEAASEMTGQPRFDTCKSGVLPDAGSKPTKSGRPLRPREGAKCAPTPLHHPTTMKDEAGVREFLSTAGLDDSETGPNVVFLRLPSSSQCSNMSP